MQNKLSEDAKHHIKMILIQLFNISLILKLEIATLRAPRQTLKTSKMRKEKKDCAVAVSNYLGIANLQWARFQLLYSGILGGYEDAIFSPENRGHQSACSHTAEHQSSIHSYRLIHRTLSNYRRRPVCNHWQEKKTEWEGIKDFLQLEAIF